MLLCTGEVVLHASPVGKWCGLPTIIATDPYLSLSLQKLDVRDNPSLIMPPKPIKQVKGSGAEWYNIDFDPEILKKGAVASNVTLIKGAHTYIYMYVQTWL